MIAMLMAVPILRLLAKKVSVASKSFWPVKRCVGRYQ
jgi:hypothetical protein